MILVDTSVWVDHLRRGNARLAALLEGLWTLDGRLHATASRLDLHA